MAICEICKKENIDGVRFCFYCGHPLPPSEPAEDEKKDEKIKENQPDITETVDNKDKDDSDSGDLTPDGTDGDNTDDGAPDETKFPKWIGIVIAAVVVIAIVSVSAIALNFGSKKPDIIRDDKDIVVDHDDSPAPADDAGDDIPEAREETEPKDVWIYDNILDKTDTLVSSDMLTLQSQLELKSDAIGLTVKMIVDHSYSGSILDYVADAFNDVIGSNGIMIVIDDRDENFAVCPSGGKGEKLMTSDVTSAIRDKIVSLLERGEVYSACSKAIDYIPDSVSDAELYSYEQVSEAEQVVYADSGDGTMKLIDWSGDKPRLLFSTDTVYFGNDGVTYSPSESKDATPAGTFRLGFAFSNVSLDTALDTIKIKPNMVWVDDPDSIYYNMLMTITNYTDVPPADNPGKWDSSELTYEIFTKGDRYACILIEHNGDGFTKGSKGKGSCMYISGKTENLSTSYGDVNISASDMKELLSCLDESKDPHIIIE